MILQATNPCLYVSNHPTNYFQIFPLPPIFFHFLDARFQSMSASEIQIDDEDYEEMVEQLEAFKLSSKLEMVLPPGLKRDDIRVAKMIADTIGGLKFIEFRRTNNSEQQWKIIKE